MTHEVNDENRAPKQCGDENQPPPYLSSSHGSRAAPMVTPQRGPQSQYNASRSYPSQARTQYQPATQPGRQYPPAQRQPATPQHIPYANQHGHPRQQQQYHGRPMQHGRDQRGEGMGQRMTQPQPPSSYVPASSDHLHRHGQPQSTQQSGSALDTARLGPRASGEGSRSVPARWGASSSSSSSIHLSPPLRTSQAPPKRDNTPKHGLSTLSSNSSTHGNQGGVTQPSSAWPPTQGQPSLRGGRQPPYTPYTVSGAATRSLEVRAVQEARERERRLTAVPGLDMPEEPASTDSNMKAIEDRVATRGHDTTNENADTTTGDDDLFSGLKADELDDMEIDAFIAGHDPLYLRGEGTPSQHLKEERLSPVARLKAPPSGSQLSMGSTFGSTKDDPIIVRSSSPIDADEPIVISSSRSPSPDEDETDLNAALLERKAKRSWSHESEPRHKSPRQQPHPLEVQVGRDVVMREVDDHEDMSGDSDEDPTRTIADLLEALSIEVEHRGQLIGSAASLVASFDDTEEERQRVTRLFDLSSPLVLTREALETIMSALANGFTSGRHRDSPTARLAIHIARGRLERATALVFKDFPGGKINIAKDEYFPAAKTVSLVRAAHEALGIDPTRPLCPKVTSIIIRPSAAQDLFDNYHVAMDHLRLLASPTNLCVDFDMSQRLDNDLIFDITLDDDEEDEYSPKGPYNELSDMSSERGAALGTFITHVWPSIEVVSFHQGSDKALPYCGIPVKHVIFCRSGRFSPSVEVNKRRGYLRDWEDKAGAVLLKEVSRADAVLAMVPKETAVKRKKVVSERAEAQTAAPRSFTRDPNVPLPRSGPTWLTDDKAVVVDPFDKPPADSDRQTFTSAAAATLRTAQWDIHLGSFAKISGGVSRKSQLHRVVKQLVLEVAKLREELDEPKLRVSMGRFLSGVMIETHPGAVQCQCCAHNFRMDPVKVGNPTTAPVANFMGAEISKNLRGKAMQGKPSNG